jgi:hypothetical protein
VKPLLTIGMATYDDWDGVYFTVQSIRLMHPEVTERTEILILDNQPHGRCRGHLEKLAGQVKHCRYLPFDGFQGTAVRDILFREAQGDFVLSIDCHVLFVPGSLQKLLDYLAAHPDTRDLVQGPLLHDNLLQVSTHMEPRWNHGMYGVWASDPRGAAPDAPPFEIPMQGLGAFVCRKAIWPGFHPDLRGFGGEEGYIHEKIRRAGGRTLCLPFLRWLHRFGRPAGVPYKNTWEDRIRNYLLIAHELGTDPAEAITHFREHVGREATDRIVNHVYREIYQPEARYA